MYNLKGFVRYNKLSVAITVFLLIFTAIHVIKPALLYNAEGGFRPFGVGYRHKTVIPIWLISINIAILSYLAVFFYLAYM